MLHRLTPAVACWTSRPPTAEGETQNLRVVVDVSRSAGHQSLGAIADELNDHGILTRRGGQWHKSTVMNLLGRLERLTI